jgi:hypothetical protein
MQVAIWLWWKAKTQFFLGKASSQVFLNDMLNKI